MKLTKGKQKITMKKVEAYTDRVVTFSKRKSGILKKMNEIASQCDVETALLVFSETGKPYTFAYPSSKEAFGRFKNPLGHEPFDMGPLVEAYKRRKIQVLMQRYVDLVDELEIRYEKENILKKFKKENKEKMWWVTPKEGWSVKEKKGRCQAFVDLHDGLSYMTLSSSQESCGGDGETYA